MVNFDMRGQSVKDQYNAETLNRIEIRNLHFRLDTPPAGAAKPALLEPSLVWLPLAEAFEDGEPNLFSLLRWDYRLVQTMLIGMLDMTRGAVLARQLCQEHRNGGVNHFACNASPSRAKVRSPKHAVGTVFWGRGLLDSPNILQGTK